MPTKLPAGHHRIGAPTKGTTKSGTTTWRTTYSVRTHDDKLIRNSAFGSTAAASKKAARLKIQELLQTGSRGPWKPSSGLVKFIDQVSLADIEKAGLRPRTEVRYRDVIRITTGGCKCSTNRHPNLNGYSIAGGLDHEVVEQLLVGIAKEHGSETAHQAYTVLSKYVVAPARRRNLVTHNPLEAFPKKVLAGHHRGATKRDTDAVLTEPEYWRVVDYLLNRDDRPLSNGATKHQYVRANSRTRASRARDQLLLAAGTGLRANEISTLTWEHVIERDGRMYVEVLAENSKTGKPRIVPVLDEVAQHLRNIGRSDKYVVGSPADGGVQWEKGNRDKALRELFREMAAALDLDILEDDFRAHGFRHTLSSIWAARGIGVELRARWFGHTIAVNQTIYTDLDSLDQVAAAMHRADTGRNLAAV